MGVFSGREICGGRKAIDWEGIMVAGGGNWRSGLRDFVLGLSEKWSLGWRTSSVLCTHGSLSNVPKKLTVAIGKALVSGLDWREKRTRNQQSTVQHQEDVCDVMQDTTGQYSKYD